MVPPGRQHMMISRITCGRSVSCMSIVLALSYNESMLPAECASAPTASMQRSGPRPFVISMSWS
jgi:hypothetical protein